jgi:hypothetical protein
MPEPTLLDALLEIIDAAAHDGDDRYDQPATLWFAAADPTGPDPDGITIGHKIVDDHPYDHLLGFTAPDEWTVLGVTCCGWAGSLDSDLPPSMQEGRRRMRQTFLVGRSGATASAVHFQDGGEPIIGDAPPTTGRMVDVLLRCLGAPTAPPEHDTGVLFTTWWLNDVVGAGRTSPTRLTWKQVCDEHPGVRMLRAAGTRPLAGDPVLVGRALANVFDWSRLRELYTTVPATDIIEPHLAGWMDDGMLSRHLLGQTPPADVLLSEALDHVTPSTGRRLVVAAAELLGTPAAASSTAIDTRAWPTS